MTSDPIDDELRELLEILALIFRSLRKHDPELADIEPLKHAFSEAGLRDRHGRLLLTLAVAGPQTVGELAGRLALAPATTSLLVGELDRAGFVERHEDEGDRRRTIVSLPESIRGPAAKLAEARLEPLRRTLEQLTPTARRNFIQGLRILSREASGQNRVRPIALNDRQSEPESDAPSPIRDEAVGGATVERSSPDDQEAAGPVNRRNAVTRRERP